MKARSARLARILFFLSRERMESPPSIYFSSTGISNNTTAFSHHSASRRESIRQFFALQERERLFGRSDDSFDEESMANVLRRTSVYQQRIAHLRASQDAQAVMVGDGFWAAPVLAASKRSSTQEIRQNGRRTLSSPLSLDGQNLSAGTGRGK